MNPIEKKKGSIYTNELASTQQHFLDLEDFLDYLSAKYNCIQRSGLHHVLCLRLVYTPEKLLYVSVVLYSSVGQQSVCPVYFLLYTISNVSHCMT